MNKDESIDEVILTAEEKAVAQLIKDENFNIDYHTKKLAESKLRLTVIKAGVKATANPLADEK